MSYRKSDQKRKAKGIKQECAGRSINIHRRVKKFTTGPGDKLYKRAPGAPEKMGPNIHIYARGGDINNSGAKLISHKKTPQRLRRQLRDRE